MFSKKKMYKKLERLEFKQKIIASLIHVIYGVEYDLSVQIKPSTQILQALFILIKDEEEYHNSWYYKNPEEHITKEELIEYESKLRKEYHKLNKKIEKQQQKISLMERLFNGNK